ncbi:MAG: hypothetical protein ACW98U_16315 [Candidatus Thorarchaeota archaeon]|jgi:hypothetical protein
MKKKDERWLLSSIAKAWKKVHVDGKNGLVWTERDTVSALYRHLVPLVENRNRETSSNLGVLTEVRIRPIGRKTSGKPGT